MSEVNLVGVGNLSDRNMKWACHVLDKFLAPNVSAFSAADIPDMSKYCSQSNYWLANFYLNSILRASYPEPTRQFVFNYLRRAEAAFTTHALAKQFTEEFLGGSRQSLSLYIKALFYWETFLSQSWLGYELLRKLFKIERIFEKNDDSLAERVNLLYNQSKHAEKAISSGQIPTEGTVPVWLTNEGLKGLRNNGCEICILWQETAEVLRELSKWAMVLQDPLEAKETLQPEFA